MTQTIILPKRFNYNQTQPPTSNEVAMIRAKDVAEQLDRMLDVEDEHIDLWITDVLVPRLCITKSFSTLFRETQVSRHWITAGKFYSRKFFIEALQKRGFVVVFVCGDEHGGSGCYFDVSCRS